jgi:hypothetical protein
MISGDSISKKRRERNLPAGWAHPTAMDGQEGGKSAMRMFLFFVVMLLFMALGALEVVASRTVPLP